MEILIIIVLSGMCLWLLWDIYRLTNKYHDSLTRSVEVACIATRYQVANVEATQALLGVINCKTDYPNATVQRMVRVAENGFDTTMKALEERDNADK